MSRNPKNGDTQKNLTVLMMAYYTGNGLLHYHWTNLAIRLKEAGVNVVLIAGSGEEDPGLYKKLSDKGIKLHKVPFLDSLGFTNFIRSTQTLHAMLKSQNIDVIHANGIIHMMLAFMAIKLWRRKTKLVVTLHSTLHGTQFENIAYAFFAMGMNACADLVLPVADVVGNKLKQYGLIRHVFTVHNGIELESFCDEKLSKAAGEFSVDSSDSTVKIGYCAQMILRKGHKYLIEAVSQIHAANPNIQLFLTGDGPLKKDLERFSEKLGVKTNVVFTGKLQYEGLFRLLNRMDIYAFPSLSELLPFAIIEAMACAKPIVATNVGGIPELIINNENGILVQPMDSKKLAGAIKGLIDDPRRAKVLGSNAKKSVEINFNSKVISRALAAYYNQVCSK